MAQVLCLMGRSACLVNHRSIKGGTPALCQTSLAYLNKIVQAGQ